MNPNNHYQQNMHSFQRPQPHAQQQQQIPKSPVLAKKDEYVESLKDLLAILEKVASIEKKNELTDENYFEVNIKMHEFERCTAVQLDELSKHKNRKLRQLKKI